MDVLATGCYTHMSQVWQGRWHDKQRMTRMKLYGAQFSRLITCGCACSHGSLETRPDSNGMVTGR
jgi:hypothetical protein